MMFLLQTVNQIESAFYLLQTYRIDRNRFLSVFYLAENIFHFDISRLYAFAQWLHCRINTQQRPQDRLALLHLQKSPALIATQILSDRIQGVFYLSCMGEHLLFVFQKRLFSGLKASLAELVVLKTKIVFFFTIFFTRPPQPIKRIAQITITLIFRPVLRKQTFITGPNIDHTQLEAVVSQKQILVLGMYIDKLLSQLFEHCQGNGRIIDKSPTFSCRRQLSA
ncbi:unknown [Bacteroides sp. CAG:144]|nr:unknown [Bacteroides sp. CAG:144]